MLPLNDEYDKIYRYCYFKLRNRERAEDVTQEAFLRFYSKRDYVDRGKPLAYLYTIARNLCVDAFRERSALPLNEEAYKTPVTESGFEVLEDSLAVRQALETLAGDEQEILLLRYANELSMGEISGITDLSRFAVRRKINAAVKKLKETFKREDF
jgi:RNA polymerase sigma-70 factor (ECF subfamily)